ncbi:galactitol-1-phosphate 5-dehydrogenase [Enterococcus sp. UD-01]|jgi:L-iditol 2-dehydrogenase|uniref:galactitol-1-phosphate 5-dehydrogenase n=1 Tax=Enterococcus sp. UD-01 TaxID=3373911 RepID=UPI003835E297
MKALLVKDKEKMELAEVAKPQIKDDEVLIKVAFCGVCGSDLPRYFEGAVHQFPQILGHEFSGTIAEVGQKVSSVAVGERVIAAPLTVCGKCEFCLSGQPQMCENYGFIGSHQPGAFAEYVAVPAQNINKVPDQVSLKEAALIEPFTVGLHAVERLPLKAGETCVVFGAGTIGLMVLTALRAKGVGQIIMIDVNDQRLEFAKAFGADVGLNPSKVDLIAYFSEHAQPTAVYETAGHPTTQVQAITVTKKKGKVIYVGTSHRDVLFKPKEFEQIFRKELIVTGSMMSYSAPFPGYEWATALDFIERGMIHLRPLITGVYHLTDAAEPFYALTEKNSKHIKALYEIGGEE